MKVDRREFIGLLGFGAIAKICLGKSEPAVETPAPMPAYEQPEPRVHGKAKYPLTAQNYGATYCVAHRIPLDPITASSQVCSEYPESYLKKYPEQRPMAERIVRRNAAIREFNRA